ncbi:unnamed protein product, partial [Mesorhabditis belari]|uniref:Uncharacterized protein n=1 Tax=Mesorhabditis belari TaxID=2138241 RepID=A0AAF3FEI5_9BILA
MIEVKKFRWYHIIGILCISLFLFFYLQIDDFVFDPYAQAKVAVVGCPSYNYVSDAKNILDLLTHVKDEPECHREPGLTVLENGEVRMAQQSSELNELNCNASCTYRDGYYQYHFGPSCIIGQNCSKFECDFVFVHCFQNGSLVHIDQHMQIVEHKRDRKKVLGDFYRESPSLKLREQADLYQPSVYILVLDAAGRFPAQRQLKKTYKFMLDELGATDFKQYAQVGGNSRPNALVAFFGIIAQEVDRSVYGGTTINASFECSKFLDDKAYIAFEYEDAGYQTIFAEDFFLDVIAYTDCASFKNDPTIHWNRPYLLPILTEEDAYDPDPFYKAGYKFTDEKTLTKHIRNATRCGEAYLDVIEYYGKFVKAYKGKPKMGIRWTIEGHNKEKWFRISDKYHEKFMRENKEELENSFVILMGDHGARGGKVIGTKQGHFERYNPLMLFAIPKKLRNTPMEAIIRKNSDKLFTPHDLYATLIDIVRHQSVVNFQDQSFLRLNGTLGNSWLRELDPNLLRDCRHLPIPSEFCNCNYGEATPMPKEDSLWLLLPNIISKNFNQFLADYDLTDLCESVAVKNLTKVARIPNSFNSRFFEVEFFTHRDAEFSAIFKLEDGGELVLEPKQFLRINRYGQTASCLLRATHRPMCYCKIQKVVDQTVEQRV